MKIIAAAVLILGSLSAGAQEIKRSDMANRLWFEGAVGQAADSGIIHGEGSAVGDRRDATIRYQYGALGLLANYHQVEVHSEKEQEAYSAKNFVWGLGVTVRWAPFGDKGGILGGSHFIAYLMGQTGRSDYHYSEGPDSGTKSEVKADIVKANGMASGMDFFYPAVFGLWIFGGGGWESNNFQYKITSDPNDDGKANIRQTFTYLRAGLAFSY